MAVDFSLSRQIRKRSTVEGRKMALMNARKRALVRARGKGQNLTNRASRRQRGGKFGHSEALR
jgi:hypothetical protein